MAERPALFSTPMVRQNRAGLKWQTRRTHGLDVINRKPDRWSLDCVAEGYFTFRSRDEEMILVKPQFGGVGDTIWVRETWAPSANGPLYRADPMFDGMKRGDFAWRWKPSLHMPRWASRDSYVITDVRAERLLDITEEGVEAEGVTKSLMDEVLGPWARKANAVPEHWIYGADEGLGYCRPCAEKEIKRLRKERPSGEYWLDGGWPTEGDSQASCYTCNRVLDNSYTNYACESEIDHWSENGFQLNPMDALSLQNIIGAVGFFGETGPRVKRFCYAALLDAINGPGSWDRNPWVIAYAYDNPARKGVTCG